MKPKLFPLLCMAVAFACLLYGVLNDCELR